MGPKILDVVPKEKQVTTLNEFKANWKNILTDSRTYLPQIGFITWYLLTQINVVRLGIRDTLSGNNVLL